MDSSQAARAKRQQRFQSPSARGGGQSNRQPLHLLSSPSRAVAPPKAGEQSLLDSKTQEEYRGFIQQKIDAFRRKFPSEPEAASRSGERKEMADNVLIIFRKLREGLVASSRRDNFAIEVYESSACWSVIFQNGAQATSILAQLPELRKRQAATLPADSKSKAGPSARDPASSEGQPMSRQDCIGLVHLLHALQIHHPSQAEFQALLKAAEPFPIPQPHRAFARSLATALRRNNYVALNELTDPQTNDILRNLDYSALHAQTLLISLQYLREVARMQVWQCVHSAYRELSDEAWLARSLCLGGDIAVHPWINGRVEAGEAAKKPTGNGWLVVRKAPAPTKP